MDKEQLLKLLKEHLEISVEIEVVCNPAGSACWPALVVSVTFDGEEVASHQGSIYGLVEE